MGATAPELSAMAVAVCNSTIWAVVADTSKVGYSGLIVSACRAQAAEITEQEVYTRLARLPGEADDQARLRRLAADKLRHHEIWRSGTGRPVTAKHRDRRLRDHCARERSIRQAETGHREELVAMLDGKTLTFAGAIVLGLNDAPVAITLTVAAVSFLIGLGIRRFLGIRP